MSEDSKKQCLELGKTPGKLSARGGRKNIFKIFEEIFYGDIFAILFEYGGRKVLADLEYSIEGNGLKFKGRTDRFGRLKHPHVPGGFYTLKVLDAEYQIPSVDCENEPYQVWVVGNSSDGDKEQEKDWDEIVREYEQGEEELIRLESDSPDDYSIENGVSVFVNDDDPYDWEPLLEDED